MARTRKEAPRRHRRGTTAVHGGGLRHVETSHILQPKDPPLPRRLPAAPRAVQGGVRSVVGGDPPPSRNLPSHHTTLEVQRGAAQPMSLTRVIRPGIFTDISPPRARVIWTCIRLRLASQSPPPSPATSGAGKVFPGSWSPRSLSGSWRWPAGPGRCCPGWGRRRGSAIPPPPGCW